MDNFIIVDTCDQVTNLIKNATGDILLSMTMWSLTLIHFNLNSCNYNFYNSKKKKMIDIMLLSISAFSPFIIAYKYKKI